MTRSWGILDVDVPAEFEESILAEVGGALLGAEIADGPSGSRMSLCFDSVVAAEREAARLRAWLAESLGARGSRVAQVREVADEGWVEMYEQSLVPLKLGRRFVVHRREGSFVRARRQKGARRGPLLIVPGRAFGTGEHPTTRLCVEALENHVDPGSAWVDLGTGTGILALVAERLGASRVLALDRDPEAIALARDVVGANSAGETIRVECGTLDSSWGGPWDGVVANIALPYFLHGIGTLAARIRQGGTIVASGFLRGDVDELQHVFMAAGLHVSAVRSRREWAALVAVRKP